MRMRILVSALGLLALSACASAGIAGSGEGRSQDLIGEEELTQVVTVDCYDAIQRLRPAWLRSRGPRSMSGERVFPTVYLDGRFFGGIRTLYQIRATDVASMRFLSASDATTRFGTGHEGGAILIETKR